MMSKKPTSDGMEIIERMIGDDTETREIYEQAKVNVHVAQLIYDARTVLDRGGNQKIPHFMNYQE